MRVVAAIESCPSVGLVGYICDGLGQQRRFRAEHGGRISLGSSQGLKALMINMG